MPLFKSMSQSQLQKHIRSVAKDTGLVRLTRHALARMQEYSVLADEIYHCLQGGKILQTPEEDMKTGHLVCRMECYGASKNLAVCAALDEADPAVIVVTVIVK